MAANLLDGSGLAPSRKVIDVSVDGADNQGRPVTHARDEAVARRITIIGLPIMLKKPGSLDDPDLDLCFRDCVIGGPGAFMVPARERSQLQPAIKAKILLEVSADEAKRRHRSAGFPQSSIRCTSRSSTRGMSMWQDSPSRS